MHLSLITAILGSAAVQSAVGAPTLVERAPFKVLVYVSTIQPVHRPLKLNCSRSGNDDGWAEANVRAFYKTLNAAGYNVSCLIQGITYLS
jgi:hypothetical protein